MGIISAQHRTDAVIIGDDLTGLLLGASLTQAGMKVTILQSGDGGCFQHAPATIHVAPQYERILACHDLSIAEQFAFALQTQLQALGARPRPYLEWMPLYTYARDQAALTALEAQQTLYSKLRLPCQVAPDAGGCPFPVTLSIFAHDQFLANLSQWTNILCRSIRRHGGRIYPQSPVIELENTRVYTQDRYFQSPLIILTTGIPLGLRDERLQSLLHCRRLVHCRLLSDTPLHSMQQSVQPDGLYLCPSPQGIAVTLHAGSIGSKKQHQRVQNAPELIRLHLPDCRMDQISYSRSVITLDGLPRIGTLPGTRFLFASGMGESGILGEMHAAALLTRHILGRSLPEDSLYSPQRDIPSALLRQARQHQKRLRLTNSLRFNAPRCSHCGGFLRYSAASGFWECALCHSSFTIQGRPLEGPGMVPVKLSPRHWLTD